MEFTAGCLKTVSMVVITKQTRPANGWRIKECMRILRNKYEIKFGRRQILRLLRLTDVIDEDNNVLGGYRSLMLFQHQAIYVAKESLRVVAGYRELFLTKRGIVFVGRLLQMLPNVPLTQEFCDFLKKYRLLAVRKEVKDQ